MFLINYEVKYLKICFLHSARIGDEQSTVKISGNGMTTHNPKIEHIEANDIQAAKNLIINAEPPIKNLEIDAWSIEEPMVSQLFRALHCCCYNTLKRIVLKYVDFNFVYHFDPVYSLFEPYFWSHTVTDVTIIGGISTLGGIWRQHIRKYIFLHEMFPEVIKLTIEDVDITYKEIKCLYRLTDLILISMPPMFSTEEGNPEGKIKKFLSQFLKDKTPRDAVELPALTRMNVTNTNYPSEKYSSKIIAPKLKEFYVWNNEKQKFEADDPKIFHFWHWTACYNWNALKCLTRFL